MCDKPYGKGRCPLFIMLSAFGECTPTDQIAYSGKLLHGLLSLRSRWSSTTPWCVSIENCAKGLIGAANCLAPSAQTTKLYSKYTTLFSSRRRARLGHPSRRPSLKECKS